MRHGRIWRGATYWTQAHRAWIAAQRYGDPALAVAIGYYRATLEVREAELAAVEAELVPWAAREPLAGPVARLGCYRGIAELGGLTLAAEVVDWRRFPAARAFMSCTGLVPAEYSSGERTRRGHITKAGSEPVRGRQHPGVEGACGVAARALRGPVTPGRRQRDLAAIRAMRSDQHALAPPRNSDIPSDNRTNQAQELQKLDGPLLMRSLNVR